MSEPFGWMAKNTWQRTVMTWSSEQRDKKKNQLKNGKKCSIAIFVPAFAHIITCLYECWLFAHYFLCVAVLFSNDIATFLCVCVCYCAVAKLQCHAKKKIQFTNYSAWSISICLVWHWWAMLHFDKSYRQTHFAWSKRNAFRPVFSKSTSSSIVRWKFMMLNLIFGMQFLGWNHTHT